jgi:peroxiredoxin
MRPFKTFPVIAAAATVLLAGTLAWTQARRGGGLGGDTEHPVMKIGTHIPDFTLPGADGKMHSLKEWNSAKFLMIVFECNHCPESQNYESRIKALYDDYKGRGVQLVAINPNDPASVRLNELGYTDLEDSLPEMKIRMADRHITWPYLYDGETQATATKFGVVATPHVFIFDQERKLRFEGEIDNNQRPDLVKRRETRDALEALLAGKPVKVTDTRVHGCSTKWKSKQVGSQSRAAEMERIKQEPVTLETVDAAGLKKLKQNDSGKVELVVFWSSKCKTCEDSMRAIETTWRMYRLRAFTLVRVNTDPASSKNAVMEVLNRQHASTSAGGQFTAKNLQSTLDLAKTQAAFGEKWKAGEMFSIAIGADGKVVLRKQGLIVKPGGFPAKADLLDAVPSPELLAMRRSILANMPDTAGYPGNHAYWQEDYQKMVKK